MSCWLGGVILPNQLYWSDEFADACAAMASRRTIGGLNRYWSKTRHGGRPITLEAAPGFCWIPDATIVSLRALAAVPGKNYALALDTRSFVVMFRDPPFELAPLSPYRASGKTLSGALYWTGKINLIEV